VSIIRWETKGEKKKGREKRGWKKGKHCFESRECFEAWVESEGWPWHVFLVGVTAFLARVNAIAGFCFYLHLNIITTL
jgi:hypothetical protein